MEPWAGCRETHISAVFLAGDAALKFKKPVRTAFLDYSTRMAREAACDAEVRLNRRLSPDVYHGVRHLDLGYGVAEPVVVMRRLPDAQQLHRQLVDPAAARESIRAVARCLTDFHEHADRRMAMPDTESAAEALIEGWRRECDEIDLLGEQVSPERIRRKVRDLGMNYLIGRGPLLDDRSAGGKVRDGHGDLRAEHVYLTDDGVRIIDCLEFSDDLRIGDVVSDLAFLAMDLERLGFADAATDLVEDYREFSADPFPPSLLHFYIAQRAIVRAKVAALRNRQVTVPESDPAVLIGIALEHLVRATPYVLLIGGLPGAGKSAVGSFLARMRGAVYLSSDEIRHERQAGTTSSSDHAAWLSGPYSPAETEAVYAEMLARAGIALSEGYPVVLDASWRDATHRALAHRLAGEHAAATIDVLCQIDERTGLARVRGSREGFSEAGVETRTRMQSSFDDWPEACVATTDLPIMEVAGDLTPVIDRAVRAYSIICRATS